MKAELVVRGEKREVMEALGGFLREDKELYQLVRGPGRFTGYSVVAARVPDDNPGRAAAWGCLTLLSLPFVGAAASTIDQAEPGVRITAKPAQDGWIKLVVSTEGRAGAESVNALLAWLRGELNAQPA